MDDGNAEVRGPAGDMADSGTPPAVPPPVSTVPPPAFSSARPPVPSPLLPAPAASPSGPAGTPLGQGGTASNARRRSERIGPTRLSGAWTAAGVAVVLVVAMLIFILQNGRQVPISFLSFHGHLPVGVALLFSAVLGAVIVLVCGTARILQLRRIAKRRSRAANRPDSRPATAVTAVPPGAPPAVTAVGPGPEGAEPAP